jgi:pilus assembly protein Flp/PilA
MVQTISKRLELRKNTSKNNKLHLSVAGFRGVAFAARSLSFDTGRKPSGGKRGPGPEGEKRCAMVQTIYRFLREESGATAIEYGLLAAGVAGAIIAVVITLGTQIGNQFTSVDNALN